MKIVIKDIFFKVDVEYPKELLFNKHRLNTLT